MNKRFTLFCLYSLACLRLGAQCNPDTEAPVVTVINDLSVNITPVRQIVLFDTDFLANATDNCTLPNNLEFGIRRAGTGSGFPQEDWGEPIHSVTFYCDDLWIPQHIELWARDAAGNAGMDTATVYINDLGAFCDEAPFGVSCCAKTEQQQSLEEVQWQFSFVDSNSFGFQLPMPVLGPCANYVPILFIGIEVVPQKNNDPLNGVSTFDLVQINKHILGLEPLNSPYKILAADANNSRSLTTFDIVELRKLILGIYTKLPNNTSWRFVQKAFTFPDPANPFQTPVPSADTIDYDNYTQGHNFIALKVGDVNDNAVPSAWEPQPDARSAATLTLDDRLLRPGETARVALRLREATNLAGLQLALQFDPDQLHINNLSLGERLLGQRPAGASAEFYAQPEPGVLTLSWDDPVEPTVGAGETVLYLDIEARQPVLLSQALQLHTTRLRPELYTAAGETYPIAFEFAATPVTTETEIFPALPNPSAGPVFIPLQLAEAAPAQLDVFDCTGRQLYTAETGLPAGFQRLEIPAAAWAGRTGVLLYRIDAGGKSASGKIIRL